MAAPSPRSFAATGMCKEPEQNSGPQARPSQARRALTHHTSSAAAGPALLPAAMPSARRTLNTRLFTSRVTKPAATDTTSLRSSGEVPLQSLALHGGNTAALTQHQGTSASDQGPVTATAFALLLRDCDEPLAPAAPAGGSASCSNCHRLQFIRRHQKQENIVSRQSTKATRDR